MAGFEDNVSCYTIGSLWAAALPRWFQSFYAHLVFGDPLPTVEITTKHGYRALKFTEGGGGENAYSATYILLTLPEDEQIQAVAALQSTGFQTAARWSMSDFGGGIVTLTQMAGMIETEMVPIKMGLIEAWTTAVTLDLNIYDTEPIPDIIRSMNTSFAAGDQSQVVIFWDLYQLCCFAASQQEDWNNIDVPVESPTGQITPVVGLGRLTLAVEDIATMDTNISLNSGRAIFSVRGKTQTGQ